MTELEWTIAQWKKDNGGHFHSKAGRLEKIHDLIKTLIASGSTQEDLESIFLQNKIIEVCTHENAKNKVQWKKMVREDIINALLSFFPRKILEATEDEIKRPAEPVIVLEEKASEIVPFERVGKELDRSLYDRLPKPKIEIDPVMADLFGVHENE